MDGARQVLDELRGPTRSLRAAAPGPWAGFAQMHEATMAPGALPTRVKELMALVVSVVKQCDGCIVSHARSAAKAGATPEEVAEALAVALVMDGGTATVYGPRAWAAYHEFAAAPATGAPGSVGTPGEARPSGAASQGAEPDQATGP